MPVDEVVGRRRYRVLATALAVLACALALPAAAGAAEFTVDSTADDGDFTSGDNVCLTMGGECTLRAAIEESNASVDEPDLILFAESPFDGQVAGTIGLVGSLPSIEDPVFINGLACPTAAGVTGPCVGIDGPDTAHPALIVNHTESVEIAGLAVTGAERGVSVEGSTNFKVQASWFGVKLDGSPGANTTGVFVGPESDEARIGGEGPEARNVFANQVGDGLEIHGASNVRVLGDYFGVEPDGVTPAGNGKDVEVTSVAGGGREAIGTAIGTKVRAEGVASPNCDFGCNLISGAASRGIDLEGDGGSEAPAVATTIAGNYVGLDATGGLPVPNATVAVRVGKAAQTVIGGPKAGEANRINGGSVGVLAGPAAADLVVRGNLIGVDATGTEALAPPAEGIVVNSVGLATPAVEATIADNEIRLEGGLGISQQGFGARITGNQIAAADTGIKAFAVLGKHGNLIEGNSIEGLALNGILIENGLNEIRGNEILGSAISDVSGAAAIRIQGSAASVTENQVGGDAAADENVIVGSDGDAIEISTTKKTQNEVARNRGAANKGLFIHLVAAPPTEPIGPNNGIKPPVLTAAAQASAGGSAEAGAKVRVFRKQSAAAGELESFLGEAIADTGGGWKVIYGGSIPAGTIVAATQTNKTGGTSELATATTVGGAESAGGGGGEAGSGAEAARGAGGSLERTRPRTKIVGTPRKRSRSHTARFEFESDERGSVFLCKLDDKPFDLCKSPKRYQGLEPGRHVFKVRAIDPAGHVDPSPAKSKFTVLG